ncbi:MAG TPA: DNA polymerase III subunit gamma/tau [Sedimentisphaerales bacterium]|nr:DNA polymerase III subunit gamma/tau [Sedimentisphaerales bacterium]
MAYTVLARKYRSQTFDDVVGQDPIAQTLKNAIKTGRVAHAYLFTGTRGVGKTTMARILAKALNCLNAAGPTTEPCCKCDSCVAINAGEDIDVIEVDGASNNRVEEVRELRQNAIYRPARARYKIYIIDEVHMLTVSAFNALLKTLEEPPSHIKFIFATTEPNKVIATIQSRCQRFDFNNISGRLIAEQLRSILKQEKIKYEDDLVLPLAKMANGSMRDGLSLLDRLISTGVEPLTVGLLEEYLGCPNSEKVCNLIARIGDSDAAGTLAATENLIATGLGEVQIVDALVDYMRDLMVVKSTGADTELLILTAEQRKRVVELAEKFDVAGLVYNITAMEKLRWSVKNTDTPRALLDALLVRFALSEHFLNIDALLSRLQGGGAPTPIKKKQIESSDAPLSAVAITGAAAESSQAALPDLADLQSVKDNWESVLKLITDKLGPGTGGLLRSSSPVGFEGGCLTVGFPAWGRMQRNMLERNGRGGQIQSLLSEHWPTVTKVVFEMVSAEQAEAESAAEKPRTASQRRNDLISDPAVKTVIAGLDATVTGIEEG